LVGELEDRQRNETELERRLRELRWPQPSAQVRKRVLTRVRARLDAVQAEAPQRWDVARRAS
jgi:hypothetical protein